MHCSQGVPARPAGQRWQRALPAASVDSPTPHAVHSVACVVLVNHPFGQSTHLEVALCPNLPREQGICVVAPEFSKPASTVTHALWPELFWYSPGIVQARQLVGLDCPVSAEYLPGAQSLHPLAAPTPSALEYLPVPQFVQAVLSAFFDPVATPCCPAGQAEQLVIPSWS